MICKKCGNNVKSDFKYCPYCGERVISDFHDQYEGLTPPYVIHDLSDDEEEVDDAAQFYAGSPEEAQPDFERPARPYPPELPLEEPDDLSYMRQPGQEETPYFVYRPDEPESRAAGGYAAPPPYTPPAYTEQASYGEDSAYTEPAYTRQEAPPYAPTQAPRWTPQEEYAQPEAPREPYLSQQWQEPPFDPVTKPYGEPLEDEEEYRGPGMGMRLLTIFITLALAAVVSILGYRLLAGGAGEPDSDAPNPEVEAMFATVLLPFGMEQP